MALLFAVAAAVTVGAQDPQLASWKPDITLPVLASPFTFVGYGDIRFTDPANTRDSSPQMRRAEVARIALEKPAFVVISGDLVLRGANSQDWNVFDRETAPLRQAGIELFPALGNHDVLGEEVRALGNFFQRFPQLGYRRWYSVRAGNLVVLALDSTSDDGPGSKQWRWLEEALDGLPQDIDFVVITMHHPPITHSSDSMRAHGHSARPQEQELALLLEKYQQSMRARIIVVAGHVHNYERYQHGGVIFLVSGGGGATPYMVPRTADDFYRDPGPTYHICNFTVDRGELRFQMLKLRPDGAQPHWIVGDSFVLHTGQARAATSGR
jgi:hypothetical protein